jgi:hypothetical protein
MKAVLAPLLSSCLFISGCVYSTLEVKNTGVFARTTIPADKVLVEAHSRYVCEDMPNVDRKLDVKARELNGKPRTEVRVAQKCSQ